VKKNLPAYMEIRRRIQDLRKERDWSQTDIAKILEIPVWRYTKMEQRGRINQQYLVRLCVALGCDAAYLLTGQGRRKP